MKTLWTNGCFDLLHPGHVEFLKKCSELADNVAVFLNSDKSVRSLKGKERPIMNEVDRKEMLYATKLVNQVWTFNEDTAVPLMSQCGVKPLMYARSTEEDLRNTPEGLYMLQEGVSLVAVPIARTIHTSDIIERIRTRYAASSVSGS